MLDVAKFAARFGTEPLRVLQTIGETCTPLLPCPIQDSLIMAAAARQLEVGSPCLIRSSVREVTQGIVLIIKRTGVHVVAVPPEQLEPVKHGDADCLSSANLFLHGGG